MKFLLSFFFCVSLFTTLFAQPSNNDCSGIIDLGVAPFCDKTAVYTNVDATAFDTGFDNEPSCFLGNPPDHDVWFQFTTDAVIVDYVVTVEAYDDNGNPLENIQFAIYRGACTENALTINACQSVPAGEDKAILNLSNLTPNEIYFIRVDNYGNATNNGEFTLCVEDKAPDFTIEDGFSSNCEGFLYDSGGPDQNYTGNENFTFTICPDAETKCINFGLEYFNIEDGGESLTFYNGPDNTSPEISSIGGFNFAQYGGGGVCYMVSADSCMTIEFISDNDINFEGWKGYWECSDEPCVPNESISVTEGASEEQVVEYLTSPFVDVTLDTIQCPDGAYGTFVSPDNSDLGIESGLILTTGLALNAEGPNTSTGASGFSGGGSDEDLDILSGLFSNGSLSNDACIIEVDLVSYSEEVSFEYIFGSEEYETFVGSSFTDIFALLVSGPGITGIPEIGDQENLASLSNGDFVEVNSVNHIDNWEFFRNNSAGLSVEYDGLTSDSLGLVKKSLSATFVTQPCSTYHLKFAIADRGDTALDSGVFISELSSFKPNVFAQTGTGIDYFVEKCLTPGEDSIVFELPEIRDEDFTYDVVVTGTAVNGDDYEMDVPVSITFPAGETVVKIPITIFDDVIDENTESIIIELLRDAGCTTVSVVKATILIRDELYVEIITGDTLIVCEDSQISLEVEGANSYLWEPFSIFDNPFSDNPELIDNSYGGWVTVNGSLEPFTIDECMDMDSIYLMPIQPNVEITTDDELLLCQGDSVTLLAENNVNDVGIEWSSNFDAINSDSPIIDVSPSFAITNFEYQYYVSVNNSGCVDNDTISLFMDPYTSMNPLFSDTTVCQGDTVSFFQQTFITFNQTYSWDPDENVFFQNFDNFENYAIVLDDTEFTFQTNSVNDYCSDEFVFNVDVIPNEVSINQGDSVRICLGDSITLTATLNPTSGSIYWTPDTNLEDPTATTITVKPTQTTDYIVDFTNGICGRKDTITVYVDSLPNMSIEAIPDRDIYCAGEIITLVSSAYTSSDFPLMDHSWTPSVGVKNELDDYNLVVQATGTDTYNYIRTSTNGACIGRDTAEITVVDPMIEINLSDSLVCRDAMVPMSVSGNGDLDEIEWSSSPDGDFSCTDCEETILTVGKEDVQVSVTAEVDGCPIDASADIMVINYNGYGTVITEPSFDSIVGNCNEIYFAGDSLVIEAFPITTPPPGSIYTWSIDGNEISETGKVITTILDVDIDDLDFFECETLEIYWKVIDPNGCEGIGGTEISVAKRFGVPNAFSPNNDRANDVFRLVDRASNPFNYTVDRFSVYDRWGNLVYDCNEPNCASVNGWNGVYNSEPAPGDNYMYYIKVTTDDGVEEEFKGSVLLLR